MIARFRTLLLSRVDVRSVDRLEPWDVKFRGHRCRVYPPFQAARSPQATIDLRGPAADPPLAGDTTVDEIPTFISDAIQIDVHGEFDRTEGGNAHDVTGVAFPLLHEIFTRFRSLSRTSYVSPPGKESPWWLRYLTDAGEPFEVEPGKVRGRGQSVFSPEPRAWMSPEVWAALPNAVTAASSPPSDALLLDAQEVWPHIGAAIVLANTAIEVRIATALDVLAEMNPTLIRPDLWTWFTERDDWRANPSVNDQVSDLLAAFTGKSLKSEKVLWAIYTNLRKARNSFAHEGRAMLLDRTPVTKEKAMELILGASSIVDWIESLLPEAHRRLDAKAPIRRMKRTITLAIT